MAEYWDIRSTFDAGSVVLVNGAIATGYEVKSAGTLLGAVTEKPMFSQSRDAQGTRITGMARDMREMPIRVEVSGSTLLELQNRIDALYVVVDQINRRGGGEIRKRSDLGTSLTRYRVVVAAISALEGDPAWYERAFRATLTIALIADPFGLDWPLDIADGFAQDTIGTAGLYNPAGSDWTNDGTAATPIISGGVMTLAAGANSSVLRHTGSGNLWGDVQITAKVNFASIANAKRIGLAAKAQAGDNQILLRVDSDGAGAGTLAVRKNIAGVGTNLATQGITTLAAGVDYWIRLRCEGNVVTAEWFNARPTPMSTPTHSATATLAGADATQFGAGVSAGVGLYWNTNSSGIITVDDFVATAFTYRNQTFPTVLRLSGQIGGTTDALANISYTGSGGSQAPRSMLYSWFPKPAAHNYVAQGDAEIFSGASVANGWVATAVAGVIAAATSVTRTTTAGRFRSGTGAYEVICPATTDTGASYAIYRRRGFRKGVTYTARAWFRAAAGTTNARIKLGVSGDLGTETAVALSTTWTLHTIAWTPTADYDTAYVAIGISAATATTFQFDDLVVHEGTTAPTFETGGYGPGMIPGVGGLTTFASSGFSQVTSGTYLAGFGMEASGALGGSAYLDFPLLPNLFVPDDYNANEIDLAVFVRASVPSTQNSLACVASVAADAGSGSLLGTRRYGSLRSIGRTLGLPSSGTAMRDYYVGSIRMSIDPNQPRRDFLRLQFTNSGAATGTFGIDHIIVVPKRSVARSRSGTASSSVPSFIATTAETTKVIASDLGGTLGIPNQPFAVDDGLIGATRIQMPRSGDIEMLVWPSSLVTDRTDSDTGTVQQTHAGTVQVSMQPRVHLLTQG